MDNCIYNDVVEQLNERAVELRKQAVVLINNFENEIKEHSVNDEHCLFMPVLSEGVYGVAKINWYDNVKKQELNNINSFIPVVVQDRHISPWLLQLINKTEEGFSSIRHEIEFLVSIFKKINYWNKKI
jgi:hypothetical protein